MPFDYLHPKVPLSYANAGEKAEAQYLKELEQRAALLYRLGYGKQQTIQRLSGNLHWDWECNPNPDYVERLKSAVKEVVGRIYSKPLPPEKGRRVTYEDLKTPPTD